MQIDLKSGVAPISYVASRLGALIKQAAMSGGPIIITQKGRPTGVLLSVEAYTRLMERQHGEASEDAVIAAYLGGEQP